ncbi:hypothetical protein V1318_21035 [Lysobacter sp. CCNWLW3]|uniref:hypothetical protein n=1 Tax=unclassified Lysobacter TaxID=2635362 RepID=UPI002FD007EE
MYDCGSYEIMRVKTISGSGDTYGYSYGPSLNLLNGNKVEHFKFYTVAQLSALEKSH